MTLLGCIADDFMGAVQLAALLSRDGLRTIVLAGAPSAPLDPAEPPPDAFVIALHTRFISARDARAASLAALQWLRSAGCRQYFFNYSPNFDSTDDGNIGPVADALVEALGCGFAFACPASPSTGHSVFQGHLFVGRLPLSESALQRDPGTPMRDANLVRVLSRQTDGTVGLVPFATVDQGADAISRAMLGLKEQSRRYAIIDAVTPAHLGSIAAAAVQQTLITGSLGVGAALPAAYRAAGLLSAKPLAAMPQVAGHSAVLAGSCARATLFQLGYARGQLATLDLDPVAMPHATSLAAQALSWVDGRLGTAPVVIATSTTPDRVAALRSALGRPAADALVAEALATIAAGLVERGVRRLLVAGSQTADAVATRLGIRRLEMGTEIDPGVAWSFAEGGGPDLLLALKPGDAGGRGVFAGAFQVLGAS